MGLCELEFSLVYVLSSNTHTHAHTHTRIPSQAHTHACAHTQAHTLTKKEEEGKLRKAASTFVTKWVQVITNQVLHLVNFMSVVQIRAKKKPQKYHELNTHFKKKFLKANRNI